jgi:hypothetical protein
MTAPTLPPPSTIPEAEIDSSIIRQLTIHFKDNGSEKRGKPVGVHGVEIVWDVTDTAPATMDEFKNSAFDTASPYTFTFDESQRGKKYFSVCAEKTPEAKRGRGAKYTMLLYRKRKDLNGRDIYYANNSAAFFVKKSQDKLLYATGTYTFLPSKTHLHIILYK